MSGSVAQALMGTERIAVDRRGAAASDAEFIESQMRRVFRLIYRVVGNVADAQDLTQEAFVKAMRRRDQLDDPDKAAQWLGRIAVNTALDFLRRRKRATFEEFDPAIAESPDENPEQAALRGEKRRYIEDGLRLLSARERAALMLRDIEGLPAAEVAKRLDCSMATVRSHIANARVKFRRYVEGRQP
jgi:RNA polymerase sigma-70 factor, ECF subfamily